MGKWLIVAVIWLPTIAQADPSSTPSDKPASYAAQPPATRGFIPEGWAMRATFRGRAMDMQSRDWSEDPHAQPHDVEAGYGWRDGRTTALIGYESHDYGPTAPTPRALERDRNLPPPVNSPGVLGFSLVLHGR